MNGNSFGFAVEETRNKICSEANDYASKGIEGEC